MEFLYLLLLLVLAAVAQRRLFHRHAFRHLEYTCSFDRTEAREGDQIQLVETVQNHKLLPLPWLKAEITTSRFLDFAGSQSLVTDETRFVPSFFTVKGYHKVTRSWKVRCLKRGVYPIQKIVLVSTDLLGMESFSRPVAVSSELTVLPKSADLPHTFQSAQKMSGEILVRRHLLEDPFLIAGVREYTPRDPLNRIHWPATAKAGRLMVHNNLFTADQNLLVILNMQSRPYETRTVIDKEKIETGIRVCAGFFDDTLRTGLPVRFAVNAGLQKDGAPIVTNEYHGAEHVLDLMRLLARLRMESTDPFPSFLNGTCHHLTASDVVIVTAYLSEEIYQFARERQRTGAHVKIIYPSRITDEAIPEDCEVYGYREEVAYNG